MLRTVGKGNMYCFSPPVMLATFIIELGLAMYLLWKYKLDRVTRLVVAMLAFLAAFQMAEYMVCGGLGMSADSWARLGYASITILPPLGINLVYALAGKSNRIVTGAAYAVSAGFMGYFLFATDVFSGSSCLGNYVIFQLGSVASQMYTIYYYGLLLIGIGLALQFAGDVSARRKRALTAFVAGYVLFMLPTTIVNTIDPSTISGIPSIMCGFAVILALILAFWVVPATSELRQPAVDGKRRHSA